MSKLEHGEAVNKADNLLYSQEIVDAGVAKLFADVEQYNLLANSLTGVMNFRHLEARVSEQVVKSSQQADFEAATQTLTPEQRTVLSLFYFHGLTFREIAQVMMVSETTVYSLHKKMIMQMASLLASNQQEVLTQEDDILKRRALQREKNKGLIALLDKWAEEDETDDPTELERRSRDLTEFKAAMNQNRADCGEEPLYRD